MQNVYQTPQASINQLLPLCRSCAATLQIRTGLVPLIAAIKAKGARSIDDSCVQGEFDTDVQAALCK
jgi:hypothetical protein